MVFDNSRVKGLLPGWDCEMPLADGVAMTSQYALHKLADGYQPDPDLDALIDRIIDAHRTG